MVNRIPSPCSAEPFSVPCENSLAAKKTPVQIVAFDILYDTDDEIIDSPLMARKELLQSMVTETDNLESTDLGIDFFNLIRKKF